MGQKFTAGPADIQPSEALHLLGHEAGNLLYGMRGAADLLRKSGLTIEQERWLGAIERSCYQLQCILETSLPAGGCDLFTGESADSYDGVDLLEDLLLSQAPAAALKGIDLVLVLKRDLPALWRADAVSIRQLMDNLVGNAIKYTSRGQVVVEADYVNAGGLRLSVLDSGPGPDGGQNLFGLRQRGAGWKGKAKGQGLGLFVCSRIVETLGGRIDCRRRASGGARFDVALPELATRPNVQKPQAGFLATLHCHVDLSGIWLESLRGILDRLCVPWDLDSTRTAPGSDAGLQIHITLPARKAGMRPGVLLTAANPAPGQEPVLVPAPVLPRCLERSLLRLALEWRFRGLSPGGKPG